MILERARRWLTMGGLAVGALGMANAGLASAASSGQIVARLNAERTANGIPGGLRLNTAWTRGCEHHIRYEELNHISWTHVETPGRPGFTRDGQFAAVTGDQESGLGSFDSGDPFDRLPLHLASLMAPTLAEVGAFERGGRTCVVVAPGYTRELASNAIYTDPGPGRSGVPTSETVHGEFPHSPGDVVGLPQGTTTGPTIYVFVAGPVSSQSLHLVHASLRTAHKVVAIRVVDPAVHASIRPYVRAGTFFIIPVAPLTADARYRASVSARGTDGTTLTKTWTFHTAA